ncbi:MAG TPA: hypothetical protein P5318_08805 [Candidatus Hydrogenedentes bacterium]|nr:hypothetical protein [Candidatus Hydrogenedentota bacterium]HRT20212.1 hypothetical protein [Candidatus Hydrogenedentota bacterium]HRT64274.1 hypothetical protein [Candidatus Hydrogenedentota bacterium]
MAWCVMLGATLMVCLNVSADGGLTLARKAAIFQHDMEQRFLLDGQALCKRYVPTERRPFVSYNMPDNAYMTGIYLGALAMKYAVTRDEADKAAAFDSINALHRLCTVSGKKGVPARAIWPKDRPLADDGEWRDSQDGKYRWRGDVSSDQLDGIVFGYSLAFDLVADDKHKEIIAQDVGDIVTHILDNDMRVVDVDGKPTRFGNYSPQFVKTFEAMNALVLLQHLKVAAHVTGDDRFAREYRRIAIEEKYAETAVRARWMLFKVNFSDDVMLALAYYPLFRLENDPVLRAHYIASFKRSWHGEGRVPGMKAQRNLVYALLAREVLGDENAIAESVDNLRLFPLDMKWNRDTIAAYGKEFGFTFEPALKSAAPKPGEAVPLDRRARTWSAWVQDPFAHPVEQRPDEGIEYNGHDFLLAYWFGRYLKCIAPDE